MLLFQKHKLFEHCRQEVFPLPQKNAAFHKEFKECYAECKEKVEYMVKTANWKLRGYEAGAWFELCTLDCVHKKICGLGTKASRCKEEDWAKFVKKNSKKAEGDDESATEDEKIGQRGTK